MTDKLNVYLVNRCGEVLKCTKLQAINYVTDLNSLQRNEC